MFELELVDVLIRLGLGFVLGAGIGLTGVGGGVLVVPVLGALFGFPAPKAVGTASLYSFITKIYGVVEHARLGTIDYRACGWFLAGALPGSVGAAAVVKHFSVADAFNDALAWAILAAILASGCYLIRNLWQKRRLLLAGGDPPEPKSRRRLGLLLGFAAGVLMGLTSVGGGVVVIPILVLCFALPISGTVGSSIFIAASLTLAASVVYLFWPAGAKTVDVPTGVWMAIGSLAGVYLGSRLSVKMREARLQVVVILMIILATALQIATMCGLNLADRREADAEVAEEAIDLPTPRSP